MIQSIVIRMTQKHQMTATTVISKKKTHTHISHMHMLGKSYRITAVTDKKDKKS